MENKVKQLLGEYAFTVAALQHQIETLQKENEDLKRRDSDESQQKDKKSK